MTSVWILNHYAISPDMPGGTRHFDLACELTKLGYDVTIFASAFNHKRHQKVRLLQGEPWALEEVEGVKFIWLPSFPYQSNNWRRMVNMLDYAQRAYRLGRQLPALDPRIEPPDIVMGCSVHLFAVLAAYYLSRRFHAHFIMEVRDLWPQTFLDMGVWREGQPQVLFFRRLEQFLFKRAERIVILSPLTRNYLASYSDEWAAKSVYIPNGTRVSRFRQVKTAKPLQRGSLQAMFLGSIGYKNGVDLIIRAMQLVDQSAPGLLKCTLVGDGPDKQQLQQMVRDLNLHNIRFQDPIPRSQVPEYTAQADILILVERQVLYGSSNKLFDYMAAGKPIVSSVFAKHNNLVEKVQCGLSASPEDAVDLAEKLIEIARTPTGERERMGQRGRTYVEQHHDYSVLAQRLQQTLEEVSANAQPAVHSSDGDSDKGP